MVDQHGVAGGEGPEGPYVFLAQNMWEAEWFVDMSRSHHASVDIWEVTLPEDVPAVEDGPLEPPYREIDGFLCTAEPIPPERVRLITAGVTGRGL